MNQPVSKIDVGGAGFGGGVFFEEVADFEVEVWEVGGAAEPVVVGIDVGVNRSALQKMLANLKEKRYVERDEKGGWRVFITPSL